MPTNLTRMTWVQVGQPNQDEPILQVSLYLRAGHVPAYTFELGEHGVRELIYGLAAGLRDFPMDTRAQSESLSDNPSTYESPILPA
jgi:hypothetical protein